MMVLGLCDFAHLRGGRRTVCNDPAHVSWAGHAVCRPCAGHNGRENPVDLEDLDGGMFCLMCAVLFAYLFRTDLWLAEPQCFAGLDFRQLFAPLHRLKEISPAAEARDRKTRVVNIVPCHPNETSPPPTPDSNATQT